MSNDDVNIRIGAQDGASSPLGKIATSMGGLGSSASSLTAMLGPAGIALGTFVAGFVSLGAIASQVVSVANTIDALSDKANGLGESVGSLQEFQFAMEEAGNVSAEATINTLQKLQATLGKVNDNKELKDTFKQLGIDANQLSTEGPIAAFEAIKSKLMEIDNLSERAAMAQKIFGKAAIDLLPAITADADAMKESAEYARQVGAAIGDDGASAIASMNDAIGRVELGLEGMFTTVAVQLAPAIEVAALNLAEWIPPAVELANTVLPIIVDQFASVADGAFQVGQALGLMSADAQTFSELLEESRKRSEEAAAAFEERRRLQAEMLARPEEDDKKETAFEKTLKALERQVAVLQESEAVVKRREELATAETAEQRNQLELLQLKAVKLEQAKKDQEFLTKQAQKQADEEARERERKEEESRKRFQELAPQFGTIQATQGRLLTQGPTAGPFDKLFAESQKQTAELKQINQRQERLELTTRTDKTYLTTVQVP